MEIFTESNASCFMCSVPVIVTFDRDIHSYESYNKTSFSQDIVVMSTHGPVIKSINKFHRHSCNYFKAVKTAHKRRATQHVYKTADWPAKRAELAKANEISCRACGATENKPCRNMAVKKEIRANKNYHDRRIYDGMNKQGIKVFADYAGMSMIVKIYKIKEMENIASFPYAIPKGVNIKLNFQEV